jgi:hypothetical protein
MSILAQYIGGKAKAAQNAMAAMLPQGMGPMGAMAGMPSGGGGAGGGGGDQGGYSGTPGKPSEIGNKLMADLMRDFDLTPAQAAGMVGNLDHESGGFASLQEINPTVEGSRGGYGYAQWTGPRRRAFESWATENGLDPTSYEANYGFLKHELTATPEGAVIDKLRGTSSPDEAARVFSETFLRPGIPHMDSRMARAGNYFNPMTEMAGM